jgi:hypothetical protein
MVQQDKDKLINKKMSLHAELHKHRLCNLDNKCGSLIVKNAYGQLKSQIEGGHNYASVRTSQTSWKVIRSTDRKLKSILPVFERNRSVTWNVNGLVICDCGYTKRWGIPCRHIAHVVQMYSISNKCDFSHHDVDIRWWTIHAFMVFNEELNESKINAIRQSLELICELQQQQQYPIVKDSSEFCGIDYKYGKNSNKRFRSMNIDTAIQVFSFLKSKILNYEENDIATGLIGITKTVYLGDDSCDNTMLANMDDNNTSENDDLSSGTGVQVQSSGTQQLLISTKLESRRQSKPMNLQEMFASLYKEITDHSKGDTIDELNSTKRILQSIINDAKARRAAKTKKITGKMVTCTTGNTSKEHTRFKHKKQKLYG